jgi:hypothetical protein
MLVTDSATTENGRTTVGIPLWHRARAHHVSCSAAGVPVAPSLSDQRDARERAVQRKARLSGDWPLLQYSCCWWLAPQRCKSKEGRGRRPMRQVAMNRSRTQWRIVEYIGKIALLDPNSHDPIMADIQAAALDWCDSGPSRSPMVRITAATLFIGAKRYALVTSRILLVVDMAIRRLAAPCSWLQETGGGGPTRTSAPGTECPVKSLHCPKT